MPDVAFGSEADIVQSTVRLVEGRGDRRIDKIGARERRHVAARRHFVHMRSGIGLMNAMTFSPRVISFWPRDQVFNKRAVTLNGLGFLATFDDLVKTLKAALLAIRRPPMDQQ